MKKHICLLLSALLLLTLAGCGGEAALPTEPISTVTPSAPQPASDGTEPAETPAPETDVPVAATTEPETEPETEPAVQTQAFTDEAGMRDFLAGVWTFRDPSEAGEEPDLKLHLNADGSFEALRRAPTLSDGWERYRGNWWLERVDARAGELPDGLSLTLSGRYEDLDSFGDFAITGLYVSDGVWTMELSQVNEGAAMFSMYYYTYTPVLQKQEGDR